MLFNKKFNKIVAVIITVFIVSTGCSNSGDKNNNDADSTPPTENVGQNDSTSNNDGVKEPDESQEQNDEEEPAEAGEVNAANIAKKITTDIQFGSLLTLSSEEVKDQYGIDPDSLLVDGVFMPAMMNISSVELTVVELKTDENYDAVVAAMKERATHIQKTFEQYLPDQYQNALNYQIIRNGNFVLFSISHDQDKVAEVFNSFFTE